VAGAVGPTTDDEESSKLSTLHSQKNDKESSKLSTYIHNAFSMLLIIHTASSWDDEFDNPAQVMNYSVS
jgi:hypothetical protein